MATASVDRRQFLKYAFLGIAGAAVAGAGGYRLIGTFQAAHAPGAPRALSYRLAITEALVVMVDHTSVYHWAFEDLEGPLQRPQMPGPLLQAVEGDQVRISLRNDLPQAHGFRIPGVPGPAGEGLVVQPGATESLTFTAPEGGSYLYFDHLNAPVNRVLGLHGSMVVLPRSGNTPYSNPTPNVQKLFDHLGTAAHFPGEPWKPERSRVWLFSTVDPTFNAMAERGEPIDPVHFRDEYLARYFTIDGLSGAYASHSHDIVPEGRIGQPHLVRIMDAGMTADSPHIHGNHVYLLARRDASGAHRVQENVLLVDTFTDEVSQCMDWLLPFIRPPDIPGDESIPLRRLIPGELALTLGGVGQSPLTYPMHGHNEQSQSAAGGNYPQGLVTGWAITGDLDGVDFPPSDPEEKGGPPEKH